MAHADLVLEGGGVKGSAMVGAVAALEKLKDPYAFHRVASTSAGAIVAGFLAHVPVLGPLSGLLLHQGLYAGDALTQ
ncbi:hypothetical protein CVS30_02185 [Arthrobacter psychrolactophilus]|uniref:PNPLA domain-containing protein n=1 Tax=Arthrobacter psychrolactophilus TaxID=92442 RepID=A0A2V5IW60_9MICC|nr:patatin-like phospholipase family protein [Arthrobacter psychrolactophilus]PYI40341.1 hypothetical protein CVS30_02185 [Arthrobacter psychrolactophilus]